MGYCNLELSEKDCAEYLEEFWANKTMLKSLKFKLKSLFGLPAMTTLLNDNFSLMENNKKLIEDNSRLIDNNEQLMTKNSQLSAANLILIQENMNFIEEILKLKSVNSTNFNQVFNSEDLAKIEKLIQKYPKTEENWQNLSQALINSDINNIFKQLDLINNRNNDFN